MSLGKPKVPKPTPPPSPAQAPRRLNQSASAGQQSAFDRFRVAPQLLGFSAKRQGRRSLLGGNG